MRIESIEFCLSCRIAATDILIIMRQGGIGKHLLLENWNPMKLCGPFGVNIHRDGRLYGFSLHKRLSRVWIG